MFTVSNIFCDFGAITFKIALQICLEFMELPGSNDHEKTLCHSVRFLAPQPLSATNHFNFGFFAFLKKILGQNENDHAGLLDHRFEIL